MRSKSGPNLQDEGFLQFRAYYLLTSSNHRQVSRRNSFPDACRCSGLHVFWFLWTYFIMNFSSILFIALVFFRCTEIVVRFHETFGTATYPAMKKQLVLTTEVKLQGIISEVNARLIKVSVSVTKKFDYPSLEACFYSKCCLSKIGDAKVQKTNYWLYSLCFPVLRLIPHIPYYHMAPYKDE